MGWSKINKGCWADSSGKTWTKINDTCWASSTGKTYTKVNSSQWAAGGTGDLNNDEWFPGLLDDEE